jgi:hypothetical protein
LDRGFWTERASLRVPEAMTAYKASSPSSKKFEFWATGTVSKLAKDELAKLSVKVVEHSDRQIEFVY